MKPRIVACLGVFVLTALLGFVGYRDHALAQSIRQSEATSARAVASSSLGIDGFTSYNLDKQPAVWCEGMKDNTVNGDVYRTPFGCRQGEDWSIPIVYNGQAYDVTRLDLRRAMEYLRLKPVKKGKP
jgi:hypothetical protein